MQMPSFSLFNSTQGKRSIATLIEKFIDVPTGKINLNFTKSQFFQHFMEVSDYQDA